MRKTNRTVLAIAVGLALVLVGGWAFAHGSWGKRGYGYPGDCHGYYGNLSPEQMEKLETLERSFYEETAELRRELYQRRLALQGLWADPKAEPEKIKAKQGEVFDLQRQIRERALEHRLATRELLPPEAFDQGVGGYGYGMGHHGPWHGGGHMRGHGSGTKGGYGGGPCW